MVDIVKLWPAQKCALAGKEDREGWQMNSVGLGKSFGVSLSFILELKYG